MIDMSEYVCTTPFKTKALKFLSTECRSELKNIGYSPEAIVSWNAGTHDHHSKDNMSYFCHEISHVVDLVERNKSRLLQTNFGFPNETKLSHGAVLAECKVIGIQCNIEAAYPDIFKTTAIDEFFVALRDSRGMIMDCETFTKKVKKNMNKYSLETIHNMWDEACGYLHSNKLYLDSNT